MNKKNRRESERRKNFEQGNTSAKTDILQTLWTSKPTETIKDSPKEFITGRWLTDEFWWKNIFHANINNKYSIALYAETNEKIYIKENTDEYIVNPFGRETELWWRILKFVQTNKTTHNTKEENKWIIIDPYTLEKITLYLKDDPDEYITYWRWERGKNWQCNLLWKNVMWVKTNKSADTMILIDVDTLEKTSMHIKDRPEDKINDLGKYAPTYILWWKTVAEVPINNKERYIVCTDTLERVSIKDYPHEILTGQIHNFGISWNFIIPFAWRNAGKFEINNDKNNCAIIYFDTLEKVTIKDHPEEVITNYVSHIPNESDYKIFLGRRDVLLANINNSHLQVAIYPDTIEKVTLKGCPEDIITWIYLDGYFERMKTKVQINNSEIIEIDSETILPK